MQILVNCAGQTKRMPTLDFPEQDWNAILETNLTGTLRACKVFGRHMLEQGYGRIINIGSLTCFAACFEVAAYGASKAGVAAIKKMNDLGVAVDLSHSGYRTTSEGIAESQKPVLITHSGCAASSWRR